MRTQNLDEEKKREFDNQLAWVDTAGASEDRPPAWFGSDEEASQASLAVARSLGMQVN